MTGFADVKAVSTLQQLLLLICFVGNLLFLQNDEQDCRLQPGLYLCHRLKCDDDVW